MKVRNTMTRDVISVSPNDSLRDAYDTMRENEFRHLAVVEEDRLVGILSERDVLLYSELVDDAVWVPEIPVAHAMEEDVQCCRPGTSVGQAAEIMLQKKISCLPVTTAEGELVGLITTSDLIELLTERESSKPSFEIPFTYNIRHLRELTRI